jgi:hypothetical protein
MLSRMAWQNAGTREAVGQDPPEMDLAGRAVSSRTTSDLAMSNDGLLRDDLGEDGADILCSGGDARGAIATKVNSGFAASMRSAIQEQPRRPSPE